ncbi:MAG: hypothetical protein H7A49_11430 [Akkermansiaceae bacterium]|nr:hypothetical protein [Akkermansiaceae bacterium]MCP5546445.1 hypothetical protein [Akkermansiaceae bacterium]
MNEIEIKKRVKGALVAVALCVFCLIIWMISIGGVVYLGGLVFELGRFVFIASLVAFVASLFVTRNHLKFGFWIGLCCGISASIYLQSISG